MLPLVLVSAPLIGFALRTREESLNNRAKLLAIAIIRAKDFEGKFVSEVPLVVANYADFWIGVGQTS